MQIVGQQRIISDGDTDAIMAFYGGLFGRLTAEVRHLGSVTRYIGYQSRLEGNRHLHFLGIEAERIDGIPPGMIAWELDGGTRTVWESQDGRDVPVSREPISWRWFEQPPSGRCTGQFAAGANHEAREFWVSANAYVRLHHSGASSDEVQLVEYDPRWPGQFEEFAGWLRECLGPDVALRLEHYGSTAIPGMPAKPVIDVLVDIPSFAGAKKRAVPRLNSETWEYWWYSGHMVFIKRAGLMGIRTHHVHMAPRGHKVWEGIAFRDYLRQHPDEAARYAQLKRDLAARHARDRERYTQAKAEFVREIAEGVRRQ